MGNYFDCHLHPSFKPYLSNTEQDKRDNCWTTYDNVIGIIKSQSSLEQMKFGKVNLAVSAIYTIEKPMTSSFLIRYLAPKLSMLDEEMLSTLPGANYFDRLMGELKHLKGSQQLDPGNGRAFNIINSVDEIEEDKLNLILAIEGGHALEKTNLSLKDNLLTLKQGQHKFLYLTLTHATQFPLCSHAYAMKLVKNNDDFKPKGFGLENLGKEIIDTAYDKTQGNRLLIDIKHMSLKSRKDFYNYREQKNYQNVPIIASHMGFTGISYEPEVLEKYIIDKKGKKNRGYVQVKYKRPEGIGKPFWPFGKGLTYFNPWSLNLYDEEIPIIIKSGGLIGISLDQRILGSQKVKGEFFDDKEFEDLMGQRIALEVLEFDDEPYSGPLEPEEDDDLEVDELSIFNKRKHLRHLCNNILHVVQQGGEVAWNHMCVGSDFDGLIDPVNGCTSSAQMDKLEEDLVEMLAKMIEEDKDEHPGIDYFEGDLKNRVRGIMYNNAFEFLKKHF